MVTRIHHLQGSVVSPIAQLKSGVNHVTGMVLSDMTDPEVAEPANLHAAYGMMLFAEPFEVTNKLYEIPAMVLYDGYGPAMPPKIMGVQAAVLEDMYPKVVVPPPDALLNIRIY